MCEVAHTTSGIAELLLGRSRLVLGSERGYGARHAENQSMEPELAEGRARPALARGAPPT
jgi:hypothetical protein